MKTKAYLNLLPLVAALLLTAACNNQDLVIVDEPQPDQVRLIPFKATVSSLIPTRATLNDGGSYEFQYGDRLYVWGTDIYGELSTTNSGFNAEFSGTLHWSGAGEYPASGLSLHAVIVGPNDQIFGSLKEFKDRGYKPKTAYATTIAASDADAVQSYSHFEATATFGGPYFDFGNSQKSAFVSFDITLEDGTAADADVTVSISNGGSVVRSGSVKTVNDNGEIKAKFTAGFPGGYALSDAFFQLSFGNSTDANRVPISFGGDAALAANGLYKVARKYYTITASSASTTMTRIAPMSYALTTTQILNGLGAPAQVASLVTGCTDPTPASIVNVDKSSNPYVFTIVGTGTTTFAITTSLDAPYSSIPVSITVAE